tara:strand:+ start:265 stop:498 length:234 start_codon:yes stop_codon:yes gene_type:complete
MTPEQRYEMYEQAIADAEDYIATLEAEIVALTHRSPPPAVTYGEVREGSHRRAVVNAEIVSEALQARQAVALVADRK